MGLFRRNPNEKAYTGGKKHWTDVIKDTGPENLLLWKQPEEDFNTNSTLIVMPGEMAVFVNNGNIEAVFREKYKAEYKAHKREVSRRKLKHFLKKKPVWISGIVLLLALVAALLFLTPVGKKVLGRAPAATPPVEEPADSSQTTPPDSTALPGVPEQSENIE